MVHLKKIFPLIVFLVLLSGIAAGQTSIGFFAGLNSSKLKGDAPAKASYKSLMGLNAGVYLDISLGKIVSLSLQPSYSQEGTKIFYDVWGEEAPVDSLRIRLNYFSLPILVKISSTNKRFYALGGVETGYLLNSYVQSGDSKEDIEEDVSNINVAMVFGAGLNIPLKFGKIFIEIRYTQGVLNLTDEPEEKNFIPRVKTSGIKIFAGYNLPLSKNKK